MRGVCVGGRYRGGRAGLRPRLENYLFQAGFLLIIALRLLENLAGKRTEQLANVTTLSQW